MWLSSLPLAVTLQSSNTDFSTISWHVGLMGETNRAATLSLYSTDDVSLHSAGNLINCLMTRKRDESWWLLAQVCFRTTAFPLIHIYFEDWLYSKGEFFSSKMPPAVWAVQISNSVFLALQPICRTESVSRRHPRLKEIAVCTVFTTCWHFID